MYLWEGVKMPPYRCPMFAKAYYNNMEIWRKDHLKPCSRCGHTPYFRYVEYKKRFFKKGIFEAYCNNKKCPMFGITIASADVREDLEYALNRLSYIPKLKGEYVRVREEEGI